MGLLGLNQYIQPINSSTVCLQLVFTILLCTPSVPKKSVVFYFQTSCLIIRLIQIFYINIIYFVMTYFIIKDTLIIIYLFYNLHKNFE